MFQEGTNELDALKEAIRNEDPEAAKQHFLSAMNIFKKISTYLSDRLRVISMVDAVSVRPDQKVPLKELKNI